jgi:biotin operon repressor
MSKKEEKRIWKKVKELRKKGLLPLPTEEDIENEPTALANSQYRLNQNKDEK